MLMNTVFRKADLLEELEELEGKLKALQKNRANTLKQYQQKANNSTSKGLEVEEIQLQIENLNWKLKALF